MRPRAFALLAATLALCALAAPSAEEQWASVLRVTDGDTLLVAIAGTTEKVRLIGVNTPESVHPRKPVEPYGKESAAFLRQLVDGKHVVLEDDPQALNRDKYGRLLRYVFLEDGTLVNAEIIRRGYGHALVKYPFGRMEEFRAYERHAREHRLGLWAGEERATGKDRTPALRLARFVASVQGNRYHRPECGRARKIGPAFLISFANVREARIAGYLPCRVCRPPVEPAALR